jgi:hypothetical protein
LRVCYLVRVCVCVCVSERERERERVCMCFEPFCFFSRRVLHTWLSQLFFLFRAELNGKYCNIFFRFKLSFSRKRSYKACRVLYQFMHGKFIKNIEMSIQNLKLGLLKKQTHCNLCNCDYNKCTKPGYQTKFLFYVQQLSSILTQYFYRTCSFF